VFLTAVSENVAPLKHTNQPINQSINQLTWSLLQCIYSVYFFVCFFIYQILDTRKLLEILSALLRALCLVVGSKCVRFPCPPCRSRAGADLSLTGRTRSAALLAVLLGVCVVGASVLLLCWSHSRHLPRMTTKDTLYTVTETLFSTAVRE
jgi:hypothetical protein